MTQGGDLEASPVGTEHIGYVLVPASGLKPASGKTEEFCHESDAVSV